MGVGNTKCFRNVLVRVSIEPRTSGLIVQRFTTTLPLHSIYAKVIIIFVYSSSLPVAHLSDAPRRRLVITGDSARIQDETTESSAWFFNVLGV